MMTTSLAPSVMALMAGHRPSTTFLNPPTPTGSPLASMATPWAKDRVIL